MIHILTSKTYDYDVKPYVGTAYTIQSLIYQSLTQLFGDVPYVTPDNFNDIDYGNHVTRTPVKFIYAKQLEALENMQTHCHRMPHKPSRRAIRFPLSPPNCSWQPCMRR